MARELGVATASFVFVHDSSRLQGGGYPMHKRAITIVLFTVKSCCISLPMLNFMLTYHKRFISKTGIIPFPSNLRPHHHTTAC